MRVTAKVSGDLKAILDDETLLAAGAVRRGMENAGQKIQTTLRNQVLGAGFLGGGQKLANAWRMRVYPVGGGFTLRPSALISTNAPNIIDAFEQGKTITAPGGKYMAWPTPFNAKGGRRGADPRVSLAEMIAAKKEAAVIPTKHKGMKLWCLRVREARGLTKTGRASKRVRLFVGGKNVEILTGRIKASDRNKQVQKLLDRGYVAMFFLAKQVSETKRLDVAGVFDQADAVLEASIRSALA